MMNARYIVFSGGLVLCVQDLALCEEADRGMQKLGDDVPPSPTPPSTNTGTLYSFVYGKI